MSYADQRRDWIALASVEGVGEGIMGMLLAQFGSASDVLSAARDGRVTAWVEQRRLADGRPPINRPAHDHLMATALDPAARVSAVDELGLWTFTSLDRDYPPRLRDLDPPPAVIHGLGDPANLDCRRMVALVGTRRPTPAGRLLATRIGGRLVECGAIVVSGLAVGIDGAAHAATIQADGKTVGVIGGGHDHPGPRAHARLRATIVERGGTIVSEHHPTTTPTRGTYPRRNRIIAALADAVIVVEAPRTSGALITARLALELGRPVFVAPGRIGDWSTAGSLALLRETPARPLVGLDELIDDLGYLSPAAPPGAPTDWTPVEPALAMLGPSERAVAQRLVAGPAGLDALVADTGLAPSVISSAVTLLLMRGWVQPIGPAYVVAGPLAR